MINKFGFSLGIDEMQKGVWELGIGFEFPAGKLVDDDHTKQARFVNYKIKVIKVIIHGHFIIEKPRKIET